MATLATVALKCAKQLSRVNGDGTAIIDLEDEIKDEIADTIRHYNRRPWHLTELRLLSITTAAGQKWYSEASSQNALGAQENTRTADGSVAAVSGLIVLQTEEATEFSVSIADVLHIEYMRENASSLTDGLKEISYREFERLDEGVEIGGIPIAYTRYAEQIGIYPVPDQAYNLTFSAVVKPTIPTGDNDTSIWFDEAEELIVAGVCARVCLKYLRDRERAQDFQPIVSGVEARLHEEYVRKGRTGRIKAHC